MKYLLLVAASAIAMGLHAQDGMPDSRPESRYVEISVHDLPAGSEKDLDAAVGKMGSHLREDDKALPLNSRSTQRKVEPVLQTHPKEHVYEVDNATMRYKENAQTVLSNYDSLMIKPVDLSVTKACNLLSTDANGVYSQKRKEHSGYSRYFRCPDGDVYARDMTFFGMRKVVIKEQNNVMIAGASGRMYGYRDKSGNSYTVLKWVANDIDHAVQKVGTDVSTRDWLIQYAEELTAKEAK